MTDTTEASIEGKIPDTVLIVDDNEINRAIYEKAGCQVEALRAGELEKARDLMEEVASAYREVCGAVRGLEP